MKKRQNTSYAVMAQRIEAQDSLDDFPTPPWATRALIEHVLGGKKRVKSQACLARLHQLRGLGDAKLLKSLGRSFKGRHYRG